MAPLTRKPRPQSARLDVLAMMMAGSKNDNRPTSPADSLSPCREDYERELVQSKTSSPGEDISITVTGPEEDDWFAHETCPLSGKQLTAPTEAAGTTSAQTTSAKQTQAQEEPASHVLASQQSPATASHASGEPRSPPQHKHRPARLSFDHTSGTSTLPAYELKQAIRDAALSETTQPSDAPSTPSPDRGRPRHRRAPARHLTSSNATMGNQPSHHAAAKGGAFDEADDRSIHSALRVSRLKHARVPRRSSMNVFKRLDTKSPLPTNASATIIEVPRAATAPNLDGILYDDNGVVSEADQERSRARHAHRHSAPSPSIPLPPASPAATLTEESAARPLSASDTITDRQPNTQAEDYEDAEDEEESSAHLRVSALSPTLPAPSPIPEDSPHKYGLKDRMDTPEAATPPPELEVGKARRRSSGLAIFNEARTLQSASSFLNGLSTARRRAESRAQSRDATDNSGNTTAVPGATIISSTTSAYTSATPSFINLPASATTSTIHPYNSISHSALPYPQPLTEADLDLNIDTTNRNLGHTFKSSGFAYAPPLSVTQMKCYRSHTRLLPSRNKYAPVECAVCHADDEYQFWSCTWCALRMCTGCRKVFDQTGVAGLRERVRVAELAAY